MTKRPYKIHFVCNGNVFRSRMAEAYMRSFNLPGIKISSSGISYDATYGKTRYTLSPYAVAMAEKYNFKEHLSPAPTQTTQQLLDSADINVFLFPQVYERARFFYKIDARKAIVWNVPDICDFPNWPRVGPRKRLAGVIVRRIIFGGARRLKADLTRGNWVEIFDKDNQPTGLRLPITIANRKGLYHRGCHIALLTADNKILVQKRSKSQYFSPGLLDITLGGLCDEGETPEQSVVREVMEECGLDISKLPLIHTGITTCHSHRRSRRMRNNHFNYGYIARLPDADPDIQLQRSEASDMYKLTLPQLKKLIRQRSLRGYGRLNYAYATYERLLERIIEELKTSK
jgi:8-oxo-dGTP pyrophosphatase MutT (NUDIX family)/protein-tyrosine-phosphatase